MVMVATSATSSVPSPSLDPPDGNGNKVVSGNVSEIKRQKKEKRKERGIDIHLPEELVIDIMARLPPQSVVRLKLVCREWKSLTESAFLRDLYHSNFTSTSSSNWSILHGDPKNKTQRFSLDELELGLPSSHGHSCFARSVFTNKIKEIRVVSCTDGLFLLRLDEEDAMMIRYYIGNPVLPQWLQLPPPPSLDGFIDSGLVTQMHNNGALLGYKVVRLHPGWGFCARKSFEIFSSDTGEWSVKQVSFPRNGVAIRSASNAVSLDGKLHWLDYSRRIIVRDFFSHDDDDDDHVRAVCLPARMQGAHWLSDSDIVFTPSPLGKMICTTSQGYYVIVEVGLMIQEVNSYNVRVWRLNCDSWKLEKAWEINMASLGLACNCVPMAINCFDIDIIYLWDLDLKCFIACNVRANAKSYGTRKDGVLHKNRTSIRGAPLEDAVLYKEDTFCFDPHPSVLHFVPSLQVVPY